MEKDIGVALREEEERQEKMDGFSEIDVNSFLALWIPLIKF